MSGSHHFSLWLLAPPTADRRRTIAFVGRIAGREHGTVRGDNKEFPRQTTVSLRKFAVEYKGKWIGYLNLLMMNKSVPHDTTPFTFRKQHEVHFRPIKSRKIEHKMKFC
jgi:hypothetical protein